MKASSLMMCTLDRHVNFGIDDLWKFKVCPCIAILFYFYVDLQIVEHCCTNEIFSKWLLAVLGWYSFLHNTKRGIGMKTL